MVDVENNSFSSLSPNWFVAGTPDLEYKKYVLLAYLQKISQEFSEVRLYPALGDLIFHHQNLVSFRENKQQIEAAFPSRITEIDLKEMRVNFEKPLDENAELQDIDSIVAYALPAIENQMEEGKQIYDYIEERISIEPIGISPLFRQEGYLLLHMNPRKEVKAFSYRLTSLIHNHQPHHGISLEHIYTYSYGIANTYEHMKLDLIRNRKEMPNPATYLVYTRIPIPEHPSLLPVAKRKMLGYLA